MTKKLISKLAYITLFCIYIFYIHPYWISCKPAFIDYRNGMVSQSEKKEWVFLNKDKVVSTNMDRFKEYYYICHMIFLIALGVVVLATFLDRYHRGNFDDFFAKYTDPKLQQFCNWVNRRNKTEC